MDADHPEITLPLEPIRGELSIVRIDNALARGKTAEFTRFLATQLRGETISPTSFQAEVDMAFASLRQGYDRDGKKVLRDVALVQPYEHLIRIDMREIVMHVFPSAFAKQVNAISTGANRAAGDSRRQTARRRKR